MRTPKKKKGRRAAPAIIFAQLADQVEIEALPDGEMVAHFSYYSVGLGKFSANATDRAQELRIGLPLGSFEAEGRSIDEEIHRLVRRLAGHGLLEYRLRRSQYGKDQVVIEPQAPDYWPQTPQLGDADVLVLSRFAYLRRRGSEMVLELPRARALFRICDPKIATSIATLSAPQQVKLFGRPSDLQLLALLVGCQILFTIDSTRDGGLRPTEGDGNLVLWDFHDLVFHTRSTEGRHANPMGGTYPYVGVTSPLPAVRPPWPGSTIDLREFSAEHSQVGKVLRERHSTRIFDHQNPITLAELARLLDATARVQSTWSSTLDLGDNSPAVDYATRPYPSAGAAYELELYLTVDNCAGLARGFYHYDAGRHALVSIEVPTHELRAMLAGAELAMGAPAAPQVLITIAARFGRISWKYSSLAYALILKDVGVLTQTLYLMATDMGLGGCAIGSTNIELFARMTGIDFHVEGPVGQFAIGRGAPAGPSD